MFYIINIELENNLKEGDILNLKEKQSLVNNILNMYSDYGKAIHNSRMKKGWSFHLTQDGKKIKININYDFFIKLDLKSFLEKKVNGIIKIGLYSFIFKKYNIFLMKDFFLKDKNVFKSISPIYINSINISNNYNKDVKNDTIDEITKNILSNINTFCGVNLIKNEDIKILVHKNIRVRNGFTTKSVWNLFYVDIIFYETEKNNLDINKVKNILSTGFYKSSYGVGHFMFSSM